jgi:hypothetical protein
MYTQQEISDRLEIQDLMLRYSHAVDTRDWAAFRRVFTADAFIDYRVFGGPAGNVDETVAFLEAAMPMFSHYQHMISPPMLDLDGDSATARTMCHNPMVWPAEGGDHVFVCGLWYVDKLARTAEGWRIAERVEEKCYVDNFPEALTPPSS